MDKRRLGASGGIRGKIGQQLLAAGLITEAQLEAALEHQRASKGFLGDVLVKMGFVKAELVGQILSATINVPYVNLSSATLDANVFDLLPEEFQRQNILLPYRQEDDTLLVAMSDPLDVKAIDNIALMTGLKVTPMLALHGDVQDALNRAFSVKHAAESVLREIDEGVVEGDDLSANELADLAEDAPIVRLVNSIIAGAINGGASDIHIEAQAKKVRVRYRIDGMLYEQMTYAPQHHPAVVSRIKIMSHLNIAERRRPQDGRIVFKSEGLNFDLRVSTMQMIHGEKIVMRILDTSGITVPLENLGFFPEQLATWNGFLARPHGIILVTGPTGSGKSTTLYASLNKINDITRNIITVEDPVEYNVEGLNQSQVNHKIGVNFAAGLRTIVRQDPDIIMVGEIRDSETAEISVQAALTGHLVFSTLHTNDAPGALVRLNNMGVERFLITSSVIGVIGQRLLRRVCSGCAESATADPSLLKGLGISRDAARSATFKRGAGCSRCGNRGYKGRVAVYEVMRMTDRLRDAYMKGADGNDIADLAVQEGMCTMLESGIRKALQGDTTLEEVCRVLLTEDAHAANTADSLPESLAQAA